MTLPKWATTVTPLSKTLALIIFITFPIIGFVFGVQYQKAINIIQNKIEISPIPTVKQILPTISLTKDNPVGLANPASVYCKEQGGRNELQSGECIFPDGRKCDEWQFFRTKICK